MLKRSISSLNKAGFFYMYIANLFVMLAAFLTQFYAASVLSVTDLADVRVVQTYYSIFIIISIFGCNAYVLKCCSGRDEAESAYLQLRAVGLCSFTLFTTLAVISIYNYVVGFGENHAVKLYFYIYCIFCLGTTYSFLFQAILQSRSKFKIVAEISIKSKIFTFFFVIFLTYIFGVIGFIVGMSLSSCIGAWFFFRRSGIFLCTGGMTLEKYRDMFKFCLLVMLAALIGSSVLQGLDILFIDRLVKDRVELGLYAFSNMFFLALMQYTSTVQAVMGPKIMAIKPLSPYWFTFLLKYQLGVFLVSVIVGVLVYFLAPLFVGFIYGDKYAGFGVYLGLHVSKFIIINIFSLLGLALILSGKESFNLYINLFLMPIFIFLTYYLVSSLGVFGGASSQIVCYIILSVVYCVLFFYLKRQRVDF